jgi:hypothetical protein
MKGDTQARTELLGKMLLLLGEEPYMLYSEIDGKKSFLIMVAATEQELREFEQIRKDAVTVIEMDNRTFISLALMPGKIPGLIESASSNPAGNKLSDTVEVSSVK